MLSSHETIPHESDMPRAKRGRPPKDAQMGLCQDNLPDTPQYALGIDIGVEGFHVCAAAADDAPEKWPVWFVSYRDTPRWRDYLWR